MNESDTHEPLAEIILKSKNDPDEDLYCLCSRVILWDYVLKPQDEEDEVVLEKDDVEHNEIPKPFNYEEENAAKFFNSSTESPPPARVLRKRDHEEAASCYCSASHYSTDEHDSLRESTLHHSDSGADLSESSRDLDWEKYWAANGERLIWESWISKYGNYIDPNYLHPNSTELELYNDEASYLIQFDEGKAASKRITFTGLLDDINKTNCDLKNDNSGISLDDNNSSVITVTPFVPIEYESNNVSDLSPNILVRRLSDDSGSDKSGTGKSDTSSNGEEVRLSSGSRCSGNSFALTATTDSMTNVTRMTISSSDSVTDESSARSNSFLSSSNSQCDADQQWQQLWLEHFNEQYYVHYQQFIKQHYNRSMNVENICDNYFRGFCGEYNEGNYDEVNLSSSAISKDSDLFFGNEKSDVESSDPVTCVLKGDNQMDSSSDCPDVSNLCLDEPNVSAETQDELEKERPVKKMRSKNKKSRYYVQSVGRTLELLKHELAKSGESSNTDQPSKSHNSILNEDNVIVGSCNDDLLDNSAGVSCMDVECCIFSDNSNNPPSEELRDCQQNNVVVCNSESEEFISNHFISSSDSNYVKISDLNKANVSIVPKMFNTNSTTEGSSCECAYDTKQSDVESSL